MLVSGPVVSVPFVGTPALRKYFCAKMSVATCDHVDGTSMSFISKTTLPSGLRIIDVRFSYVTVVNGSVPSRVKYLSIFNPDILHLPFYFLFVIAMRVEQLLCAAFAVHVDAPAPCIVCAHDYVFYLMNCCCGRQVNRFADAVVGVLLKRNLCSEMVLNRAVLRRCKQAFPFLWHF